MNRPVLTALLTLSVVSSVYAQETPLEHFQKDVDVVIRLAEVDRSLEAFAELADAIQPRSGQILEAQFENIGQLIGNPDLIGVDRTEDWYVGVYGRKSDAPVVVFAIPATDTEDMVDVLKDSMKTRVHGDYVLYSEHDIPVAAAGDTVVEGLTERIVELAEPSQIAIYFNIEHLRMVYSDQIEVGRDSVDTFLNQIRQNLPQQPGMNIEAVIEMYGTMADGAFQGVDDGNSLTVTFSFDKEGLTVDKYITFEDGSETDKFFAQREPSALSEIDRLPAGAQFYMGVSDSMDMMKYGFQMSASMLENDEVKTKIDELLSDAKGLEIGSMATSMQIHDQDTEVLQSFGIVSGKPMDQVKELMRTSSTLAANMEFPGLKQTAVLSKDAENYADEKADVVVLKQEYDETLPQAEMQKRMQSTMFGEDGISTRMIYRDDHYLTSMGGGREAVERLLKSVDGGNSNGLAKWREPFPEEANFLGLIDIPGFAGAAMRVAARQDDLPIPFDATAVDNLNLGVSYSGLSMTVESDGVLVRAHIPVEQMQGISRLGAYFAALRMQQR